MPQAVGQWVAVKAGELALAKGASYAAATTVAQVAGTIASVATTAAVSFGISRLLREDAEYPSTQEDVIFRGGTLPQDIVFGEVAKGGLLVDMRSVGDTGEAFGDDIYLLICVAGHEVDDIVGFYLNDDVIRSIKGDSFVANSTEATPGDSYTVARAAVEATPEQLAAANRNHNVHPTDRRDPSGWVTWEVPQVITSLADGYHDARIAYSGRRSDTTSIINGELTTFKFKMFGTDPSPIAPVSLEDAARATAFYEHLRINLGSNVRDVHAYFTVDRSTATPALWWGLGNSTFPASLFALDNITPSTLVSFSVTVGSATASIVFSVELALSMSLVDGNAPAPYNKMLRISTVAQSSDTTEQTTIRERLANFITWVTTNVTAQRSDIVGNLAITGGNSLTPFSNTVTETISLAVTEEDSHRIGWVDWTRSAVTRGRWNPESKWFPPPNYPSAANIVSDTLGSPATTVRAWKYLGKPDQEASPILVYDPTRVIEDMPNEGTDFATRVAFSGSGARDNPNFKGFIEHTTSHRLRGKALLLLRFRYSEGLNAAELFRNGLPDVRPIVRGHKVYDPRKDIKYNKPFWRYHAYGNDAETTRFTLPTDSVRWTTRTEPQVNGLFRGEAVSETFVATYGADATVTWHVRTRAPLNTQGKPALLLQYNSGNMPIHFPQASAPITSVTHAGEYATVVFDISGSAFATLRNLLRLTTTSSSANAYMQTALVYNYSVDITGNPFGTQERILGDSPKGHKLNDTTTWEWSDNPILTAACFELLYRNQYKRTKPAERPPMDQRIQIDWQQCAIEADYTDKRTLVPGPLYSELRQIEGAYHTQDALGNTIALDPDNPDHEVQINALIASYEVELEKRFACNVHLTTGMTLRDCAATILDACGGTRTRSNGRVQYWAARYHQPVNPLSTDAWTADDIGPSYDIRVGIPYSERKNTLSATIVDKRIGHKQTNVPIIVSNNAIERDGGESSDTVNLNGVNSIYQAQRLMTIALARANSIIDLTVQLNYRSLQLTPETTVQLHLDSIGTRTYRCIEWHFTPSGETTATLQVDTPSNYTDLLLSEYHRFERGLLVTADFSLPPPKNLRLINNIANVITIDWDYSLLSTRAFEVRWGTVTPYDADHADSGLLRTVETSASVRGLDTGKSYYFWVNAIQGLYASDRVRIGPFETVGAEAATQPIIYRNVPAGECPSAALGTVGQELWSITSEGIRRWTRAALPWNEDLGANNTADDANGVNGIIYKAENVVLTKLANIYNWFPRIRLPDDLGTTPQIWLTEIRYFPSTSGATSRRTQWRLDIGSTNSATVTRRDFADGIEGKIFIGMVFPDDSQFWVLFDASDTADPYFATKASTYLDGQTGNVTLKHFVLGRIDKRCEGDYLNPWLPLAAVDFPGEISQIFTRSESEPVQPPDTTIEVPDGWFANISSITGSVFSSVTVDIHDVADLDEGAAAVQLGASVGGGATGTITYQWSATQGTLDNAGSATPRWTPPSAVSGDTTVNISLTVTRGSVTATDTISVVVRDTSTPTPALTFTLSTSGNELTITLGSTPVGGWEYQYAITNAGVASATSNSVASGTTATIPSLTSGVTYYVRVKRQSDSTWSAISSETIGSGTQLARPAAPTCTDVGRGQVGVRRGTLDTNATHWRFRYKLPTETTWTVPTIQMGGNRPGNILVSQDSTRTAFGELTRGATYDFAIQALYQGTGTYTNSDWSDSTACSVP